MVTRAISLTDDLPCGVVAASIDTTPPSAVDVVNEWSDRESASEFWRQLCIARDAAYRQARSDYERHAAYWNEIKQIGRKR